MSDSLQLSPSAWSNLPVLRSGEVQVFTLQVDDDPELPARAVRLLSADEQERASKIRVDRARVEFVVGRALFRTVVGAATNCEPQRVVFQTGRYGKPEIRGVHSNVTHSHGLIYLAVCRDAPVGVDAEWIDPALEVTELAEANFAPEEAALLLSQPEGLERVRAFCRMWTFKEAIAKADGRGLQIPLHDIKVPQGASGTGRVLCAGELRNGKSAPDSYFVQELGAPYSFSCALAIKGGALPVTISPLLPH